MKGIYFSVPDNEFSFYMSLLERFKTATVIKTDDFHVKNIEEFNLLPWQIEALNEVIAEDNQAINEGIEAKLLTKELRKEFNV